MFVPHQNSFVLGVSAFVSACGILGTLVFAFKFQLREQRFKKKERQTATPFWTLCDSRCYIFYVLYPLDDRRLDPIYMCWAGRSMSPHWRDSMASHWVPMHFSNHRIENPKGLIKWALPGAAFFPLTLSRIAKDWHGSPYTIAPSAFSIAPSKGHPLT